MKAVQLTNRGNNLNVKKSLSHFSFCLIFTRDYKSLILNIADEGNIL